MRRVVAGIGRALIGTGVLLLLFVAYQLWGTSLSEARSQNALRDDFAQKLAESRAQRSEATTDPGDGSPPTSLIPPPPKGDAVAIIKIPKIDVEKAVVEGVGVADLKKGPGHYPGTPLPGQPGNSAIAGHRTTYGAPFYRLDEVDEGDVLFVTTRDGRFRYVVEERLIVQPSARGVLDNTPDNRLTLTTCSPRFSAAQRLVVIASLRGEAVEPPPPPPAAATSEPGSRETPGPLAADIDGAEAGLSGDPTARWPAAGWGLLVLIVGLAIYILSRNWRRWPAYLLGAPFLLAALFVFYENLARLLPANV